MIHHFWRIIQEKAVLEKLDAEKFYQDVTNEETGIKISIGRKGIKETLGSGKRFQTLPRDIKKLKIATLHSLPEMIEKSVLTTDNAENIHNKSALFSYFETDIKINGKDYTVTFDIKKTSAKNHFWIHCVRINEKDSALLTSAPEGQKIHETQNPFERRIADKGGEVKKNSLSEDYEELQRQNESLLQQNEEYQRIIDLLEDRMKIELNDTPFLAHHSSYNGKFDSTFYAIDVDKKLINDPEKLKKTLIHEIQHVIQYEEGFASGANTEYWQDRIDNGYDSRPNSVRDEEWQLRKQYLEWQEEDPEFVADMERLDKMIPDMPRGEFDFDTWEQISEDPAEWQQYDAERERLEEKYGEERVWDYSDWKYQAEQIREEGRRTAYELYYDTAGEIEARETADRLSYDESDRKRYQPKSKHENLKRDNVVFANARSAYSIVEPFVDNNGTEFKNAVLLDTDKFDGISPRNWGKKLKEYLEKRIGESTFIMPVMDENGNIQKLEFARKNDYVSKNGGKQHPALGELYATSDNISKLSAIHIDEIVEVSEKDAPYYTNENSHGWFDKNGWLHRIANVINSKNGNVYQIELDIAKTEDGRVVLYALNGKTKKVGNAEVNSLVKRGSSLNSNFEGIIPHNSEMSTDKSIKHSVSTEEYEELQRKHENTLRENDIFRHMIDYLTRSIEATKGTAISEKSVEGVANRMIRRYKSEADKGKFAAEIQKLFKMMSEGKANKEDFLYFAEETIRPVVEQSKNNKQISDYAKGILSYIRKAPIKLGKLAKQEVAYRYGSYNDFRRKLFGRAQISNNGTDLDILWQQWSEIYPELFDAETEAEDQPVRLAEIIDALKEDYDSEVGYNLEEAVTYAAMELMEEYAKIPEVKALTAAQDMAQMR